MLNGMLWVRRSGASWRDLPERFGPWQTVYHHFNPPPQGFERILLALQVRPDAEGHIDWALWCVDGARSSSACVGSRGAVA